MILSGEYWGYSASRSLSNSMTISSDRFSQSSSLQGHSRLHQIGDCIEQRGVLEPRGIRVIPIVYNDLVIGEANSGQFDLSQIREPLDGSGNRDVGGTGLNGASKEVHELRRVAVEDGEGFETAKLGEQGSDPTESSRVVAMN